MKTGKQASKSVREKIVLALIVVCGALLFNQIGHSSSDLIRRPLPKDYLQ